MNWVHLTQGRDGRLKICCLTVREEGTCSVELVCRTPSVVGTSVSYRQLVTGRYIIITKSLYVVFIIFPVFIHLLEIHTYCHVTE
jgi:hypothetical protein